MPSTDYFFCDAFGARGSANPEAAAHLRQLDRLHREKVSRLINAPLVLRLACRYCGQRMLSFEATAFKMCGDGYAHQACVERER